LEQAWRELLRQRANAPAGSPERERLDEIYTAAKTAIKQLVGAEQEGAILLYAHRALGILKEFDPKYRGNETTGRPE
jgi:hypothetical protein